MKFEKIHLHGHIPVSITITEEGTKQHLFEHRWHICSTITATSIIEAAMAIEVN